MEDCGSAMKKNRICWSIIQAGFMSGRMFFKCLGIFCVCVAVTLISAITYVYFHVSFPLYYDISTLWGKLHFAWGCWITFGIWFNYLSCVFTRAGSPNPKLLDESQVQALKTQRGQQYSKGEGRMYRWCSSCDAPKPPRAHHCHICGYCVLKMDHHCPWICGCVGHFNHRYFQLFLTYLFIGCLFVAGQAALFFAGILRSPVVDDATVAAAAAPMTFCMVITGALTLAIGGFLAWNTHLVISNQTTIEWHFNRTAAHYAKRSGEVFVHDYDMGLRRNLQFVFGPFTYLVSVFLPSWKPLPFDGHTHPTTREIPRCMV
eukprot:TRINITY_DN60207_c0_g1_i1.p1 TRINITY_DN60207_c0_g1~~TRINITY_DN60207_c0_g1_i1.p1  ORF type:complete len:368 (-),score=42.84 TRINITY_DN60207_c0_g1_i1:83-1033(-)